MDMIAEPDLRSRFLQGMSCAASTVNVVTTDGVAGRAGVTVSAMTSVSADGQAPTLLVCVHHQSPAARTIIANGVFCVNLLRDDQSFISDTFAGRIKRPDGDKFACVAWQAMATGAPRVCDPLAAFDCEVASAERVGTHHVFIGQVRDIFVASGGTPLIFAHRSYGASVKIHPARIDKTEGAALRIGALHTFGPDLVPTVLQRIEAELGSLRLELQESDQRHLLELLRAGDIDAALLYDFDLGSDLASCVLTELPPYVLLPAGDPLAVRDRVSLRDLVAQRLVLLDAPPSRDYFLSLFAGIGDPWIGFRAKSLEMVRALVAQGLGYSLLATKPASRRSYAGKSLLCRPLVERVPASRLVIAHAKDRDLPAAAQAFKRHCGALFGLDL